MNIKTELLRMALIKAFAESLTAFVDGERKSVLDTLLEKYEDEGSKSFNVTLPDKTKIATITLPEPKATDKVVDEAALFEWAEAQGGIDVQVIPAVAERTVKTIRPKWYDGIIKKAMEGDDGDLVDETSGEVIPGVKRIPGGDPKSFTVRFEPDGPCASSCGHDPVPSGRTGGGEWHGRCQVAARQDRRRGPVTAQEAGREQQRDSRCAQGGPRASRH